MTDARALELAVTRWNAPHLRAAVARDPAYWPVVRALAAGGDLGAVMPPAAPQRPWDAQKGARAGVAPRPPAPAPPPATRRPPAPKFDPAVADLIARCPCKVRDPSCGCQGRGCALLRRQIDYATCLDCVRPLVAASRRGLPAPVKG